MNANRIIKGLKVSYFSLILFIVSCSGGITIDHTGEVLDKKREINNFCLSNVQELTEKYGEPIVSEFQGDKDYTWILNKEKDIKVIVFTEKDKVMPVCVRFFNMDLGMYFWEAIGWDKNKLDFNQVGQYAIIKDLKGIDKAMYKTNNYILNVELQQNRNKESFGHK